MHLLDEVITLLVEKGLLPQKNKPHKLTGTLKDFGNAISNPIGC